MSFFLVKLLFSRSTMDPESQNKTAHGFLEILYLFLFVFSTRHILKIRLYLQTFGPAPRERK